MPAVTDKTITLRNLAGAFLINNGCYLLMKRADNRKIAPGVWSGISGHMEPDEINDPIRACYREIEEESGIPPDKITALELLYVITRRRGDERNQIYVFFGETAETNITKTDEGEFYWVHACELLRREYTKTYAAMLEHFTKRAPGDRAVYVGVAGGENGVMKIDWRRCEDFER